MTRRCAALCLALVLALLAPWALADTPVSLFQSFAGNVNFTGTEATWRTSGTDPCAVITKKNQTVSKTLSGIPAGATILAAHLYWAGSGSAADYQVTLNGTTVNAQRQYNGSFVQGATTYSYFGGATDVTTIVKAKGNGSYTFGGLTVDNSTNYCQVQGVLGAFALLVIYSDPSQPFRVLNMYEGFQYTRNSSITLNLSNFRMPNPLNGATGRIGHITWEGDQALSGGGEDLSFNGTIMTDAINPPGNQFNSASNIDGDTASWGVDFDAYTVGDPIIKAGDTASTTTYASGQDLVWLNVELVAVPNVPTADLQVVMTRTGTPAPGAAVSYAIVPCNNGPSTESGLVTVTNTLPAGMSYSSVSGTGWTCNTSGQTATCTYSGGVAKNQVLPTITVNATVSASSTFTTYTDTATIAGQMFDNVSANNTASDTATYSPTISGYYAFTVGPCVANISIGAPGSGCSLFTGPYIAGTDQLLYITNLSNGQPAAVSKNNKDTTIQMQFSLSCMNPANYAAVLANYAGVTLKQCYTGGPIAPAGNSTYWTSNVGIFFPNGQPSGTLNANSAPLMFRYFDVGQVQLNLTESSSGRTASTVVFVSAPQSIKFVSIQNKGNGANPGGATPFAKAGEQLTVKVQALSAPNAATSTPATPTPNFGNEAGPYGAVGIALSQPANTTPVAATFGKPSGGVATGTVTYDDLGSIDLTATIAGQDSSYPAGTYFGVPVATDTKTVGYFYPAYFKTLVEAPMPCMTRMQCPDGTTTTTNGESQIVAGAAYSSQPFTVDVSAFTMSGKDVTSVVTKLPQFPIALTPWDNPGYAGLSVTNYLAFANNTLQSNASLSASPSISLNKPYAAATPRDAWQAPLTAYMRASASFTRPEGASPEGAVTSNRGQGFLSTEGGVRVVHGRLLVPNSFGSELLKLPLRVSAQYWAQGAWTNNPNDSDSPITYTNKYITTPAFSNCVKNLAAVAGTYNCKPAVSFVGSGGAISLDNGQATIWMQAPGAGNNGKADVLVMPSASWLPSTIGQAVFGVYKSPLIYIREVY